MEPVTLPKVATVATGTAAWVGLAISMITVFEGLALRGHHDPIDPPGINTICFGHIENVKIGEKYTVQQCEDILAADLPRYETMVQKCINVPMPPHRHAAILSFTYNVGGGALCKSTVARELNFGRVQKGCDALLLYDRANGKVIQGLHNRRVAERVACLRED